MLVRKTDKKNQDGFSIAELIIVTGLITIISAIILINFSGMNEGTALSRAARDLALNFRRAQNMALAVSYSYKNVIDGTYQIPPAVGIHFDNDPPPPSRYLKYWLFGDLVGSRDNVYNSAPPPGEKIGNDITFERGIQISDITIYNGVASLAPPAGFVNVLFVAPEASVEITNNTNGNIIGDRIEITLRSPSGQTKKVIVRNSGQISVR